MLGGIVAPVAHAVQTLSVGWKEAGVIAECFTALVAGAAVYVASKALKGEGRLLRETQRQVDAAQEQAKISQQQIEAIQEQTQVAQAQVEAANRQVKESQRQVEASMRPVLVLLMKEYGQEVYVANIGSGPALNVRFAEGPMAQSEKQLNPIGAGADWSRGEWRLQSWRDAEIRYESVDGTQYVTKVHNLAYGKYKQTVTRPTKPNITT